MNQKPLFFHPPGHIYFTNNMSPASFHSASNKRIPGKFRDQQKTFSLSFRSKQNVEWPALRRIEKSFSFCQFVSLQQTSDKLKALIKNLWRLQWIKLNNKIMRSERRERRTEFEWKDRPSVSFQECWWIKQKSNKLSANLCLTVRFFFARGGWNNRLPHYRPVKRRNFTNTAGIYEFS